MTSREQARMGWKPPLADSQKEMEEFTDDDVVLAVENQFDVSSVEDETPQDGTKIGSSNEDNLTRFRTQDNRPLHGGTQTGEILKAKISFFYQEMAIYYNERSRWNATLPDAFFHPSSALVLHSIIFSIYNTIRGSLVNDKVRSAKMNARIYNLSAQCKILGRHIAQCGGPMNDSVLIGDADFSLKYDQLLDELQNTWSDISDLMGESSLGLHFEAEEDVNKKLKGKRGDVTNHIDDSDAVLRERIERRAMKIVERMNAKNVIPPPKPPEKQEEPTEPDEPEPQEPEEGPEDEPEPENTEKGDFDG